MRFFYFFVILIISLATNYCYANVALQKTSTLKYTNELTLKNFSDSIPNVLKRGKNGLIEIPDRNWVPFHDNVSFRDTVIYNPAYLPVVFDGKIIPKNLSFLPKDTVSEGYRLSLIPSDSTFAPLIKTSNTIKEIRRNFYMNVNNIRNIRYNAAILKGIPRLDEDKVVSHNILKDLITAEDPIQVSPLKIAQIEPELKYWQKKGEYSLQLAQNHISDNWYKGGNSSFYIRNYAKFNLNYNKDKLSFTNVFEWKLSLQQTPADTLHKVSISEDLVRLENTLSYKAFAHWSYSAKLETKTQFFNSYPINSKTKNTALFAPLVVNLGLGMSYSLDKKYDDNITKKIKLTQNISPFSVNYTYIADRGVDETKFGVEKGKRSKLEIGSLINTDLVYTFNKFMTWTSRLKYFTNYHRMEAEFENKFDMALNRYLSTNIILYIRYDDNVDKGSQYGYFQVNELISFGLSYKW